MDAISAGLEGVEIVRRMKRTGWFKDGVHSPGNVSNYEGKLIAMVATKVALLPAVLFRSSGLAAFNTGLAANFTADHRAGEFAVRLVLSRFDLVKTQEFGPIQFDSFSGSFHPWPFLASAR
jgi:hypothetical protein